MIGQFSKWLRGPQTKRKPFISTKLQFDSLEDRITPTILPTGFAESVAASNLGSVTALAVAPDGKVFIAEQGGNLHVWANNQQVQNDFFADTPIHTQTYSERGLLGIAFDPNYAANHFVYVYFTTDPNNPDPTDPDPVKNDNHNLVARFTADGSNALALPGTEKVIWDGDIHSAGNHNGGAIHFSPTDGKLYIAVGDDANQDLQAGTSINSQNLETYHGKILRLNSDGSRPGDNPFFTGNDPHRDAIFALGVRNPFTFAFQPGTGRLFLDDVGQNTWEEIDDGVAGANYGWNITEGFIANPSSPPTALGPGTYHDPLLSYNHNNASPQTITGIAITGGVFYNPAPAAAHPFPSSYNGKYFFSDLAGGFNHDHSVNLGEWIRTFDPTQPGTVANPDTSGDFASQADSTVVGMALAPDGSIYYLARGNGGQVLQISFTGTLAPSITQQPTNFTATAGLSATFSVSASGTGPFSYQWQRNSGSGGSFVDVNGATSSNFTLTSAQLNDNQAQFRVIVSNSGGSVTSNAATLSVTANHPPAATITINSGLRGGNFDSGTPINFTLSATDQEDGTEPTSRFTYQVDYVTSLSSTPGGVVRPFIAATNGSASASFTPSTTGPYTKTDVLYRITFTVTDAQGLTTVTTRDLNPNTSLITLQTNPTGLQLNVDGQSTTAPTSFRSVVGFQRLLDAPLTQSLNGTTYAFTSWSDGGSSDHNVPTSASDATYTATFAATAPGSSTSVDLSGSFNRIAFANDGATFSGGGADGGGFAYSANLAGTSMTVGGKTFHLGAAGQNDIVIANGRTIALPAGNFISVSLLGAAVNGNQPNQTFVIHYTDGSSQSVAQSISDWCFPQGYTGETIAASFAYRNGQDGGRQTITNNLFTYSFSLTGGKTVSGITLPNNGNVDIAAVLLTAAPTTVDLSGSFNRIGFTTDGANFSGGGADNDGFAYSANLAGNTVTFGGETFHLGAAGRNDLIAAAGQTIAIQAGNFTTLTLLGAAVNGNQQNQSFVIHYTDGSTQSVTQSISDWCFPQGYAGETIAATFAYRNIQNGSRETITNNLFTYSFSLTNGKTVSGITLPNNSNVDIAALELTVTTAVNLSASFNRLGIATDGATFSGGGADADGFAYSANLVGSSFTAGGKTFQLGAAGQNDTIAATGQTIAIPAGAFTTLTLLGAAVNGNQVTQSFVIHYTDGSSQP